MSSCLILIKRLGSYIFTSVPVCCLVCEMLMVILSVTVIMFFVSAERESKRCTLPVSVC